MHFKWISAIIQRFKNFILSTYYVPNSVLSSGWTTENTCLSVAYHQKGRPIGLNNNRVHQQ